MKKMLIVGVFFISGCTGVGLVKDIAKTGGNITEQVNNSIAKKETARAVKTGADAVKTLAQSKVKEQETEQLKIKSNSSALETAVQVLNQIKDESKKLKIASKLLEARVSRLADEQETIRAGYKYNAWFWSALGMLAGFVLSVLLKTLSNVGGKLTGNFKFNEK